MVVSPIPETSAQGFDWTEQETSDLVVVCGNINMPQQLGWGTWANAHIYEAMVSWMLEYVHEQCRQQHCIKMKSLQVQWLHVMDYNWWSGAAHRTISLMRQLDSILLAREYGKGHHLYLSTSGLLKPALQANADEGFPEQGPAYSLPLFSAGNTGSLA
ncbi:hypothetical protein Y1Q_0009100 [Alligator mississippiensis]|uniref:Uncharacterized protein n=1 Tax=Alligator mississippiensis TaxID=8496 RepID=A0A151M296_ALLMI|nr:hypothetical protein Y1Q_0009100 [Alligator mississippiensis]